MTTTTISDGKVVLMHYTLTDDDGEVIDTSDGGDPLPYLHGAGNIVPGLERQLGGLSIGAKIDVVVAAVDGYGEREGDGPEPVSRAQFPDDMELEAGMQFFAHDNDGNEMPVWVTEVEDETVWVDFEHPLAGVTLHFHVEVLAIRDATADEMTHGHPHGADGNDHHHGHDHE
jgi:FKBP-type peptidyl-prolyl cis-trans isomerase SlyD